MELFLSQIPATLTYDEIHAYFTQFGRVAHLKIKRDHGFLRFDTMEATDRVLNSKHYIGDLLVNVERATSPGRDGIGYASRGGYNTPTSGRGYTRPRESNQYRRGGCPHCNHCDHFRGSGIPPRYDRGGHYRDSRGSNFDNHPNNRLKIVVDGLTPECDTTMLKDLASKYDLEAVYTRITNTGNHGIIEFKTFEDKETALRRLEGVEYMGQRISVRPYWMRENGSDYRRPKRIEDSESKVGNIYDDINENALVKDNK
ncbi:putative splicing factor [Astathelohania contejeani]|uniref:Splicing factor n=1 Tax=Astathelohania contejeani TaxID=164912 RepID=A0ABQ7HZE5_9MICR|nr:putative splicing factor [Thelohania contejeani]